MPSFVLRSSDGLFLEWHMRSTRPHLVHPRAYGLFARAPRGVAWIPSSTPALIPVVRVHLGFDIHFR